MRSDQTDLPATRIHKQSLQQTNSAIKINGCESSKEYVQLSMADIVVRGVMLHVLDHIVVQITQPRNGAPSQWTASPRLIHTTKAKRLRKVRRNTEVLERSDPKILQKLFMSIRSTTICIPKPPDFLLVREASICFK